MVFRNYEKCRVYVDNLNDELILQHIKSAEKAGIQTKQRVKEECINNKIFAFRWGFYSLGDGYFNFAN